MASRFLSVATPKRVLVLILVLLLSGFWLGTGMIFVAMITFCAYWIVSVTSLAVHVHQTTGRKSLIARSIILLPYIAALSLAVMLGVLALKEAIRR